MNFQSFEELHEYMLKRELLPRRQTVFCEYREGIRRCGREPHKDGTHIMYRDDSNVFKTPEVKLPAQCGKWSMKMTEGQCQLLPGHPGAHNFVEFPRTAQPLSTVPSSLSDAERCNVWSGTAGIRCKLLKDHPGDHGYPKVNQYGDTIEMLPETNRPCKLRPECTGRMQATMKKYAGAQAAILWWHCTTCNRTESFAPTTVVHDPRVLQVQEEATQEFLMRQAAEAGLAVDATETILDASEPTGDLGIAARHIRDIMSE